MQLPNIQKIDVAQAIVCSALCASPQYIWPLLNQHLYTQFVEETL